MQRLTPYRFQAKWKTYYEHTTFREQHFKAVIRQKDSETQNLYAKCEYERKRYEAEAHRSRTLSSQVSTFSHTESELRSQLNIYVEKFKQVGIPSCTYICYDAFALTLTPVAGRGHIE